MTVDAPVRAPATTALHSDPGGLCHILGDDDRTLCGGPIASDSPGIHQAGLPSNPCGGCGRPRCPDCEALA